MRLWALLFLGFSTGLAAEPADLPVGAELPATAPEAVAKQDPLTPEKLDLVGPFTQPELPPLPSLSREEAIAVATTHLNPRMCSVKEFLYPFWKHHRVFQVSYHTEPNIFPFVAIDEFGQGYLLTADAISEQADASLSRFNDIGAREHVQLTELNAAAYLQFFLRVYYTQEGAYVPDAHVVRRVLSLSLFGGDSDRMQEALGQTLEPLVGEPRKTYGKFRARTFSWLFWCGIVDQHDLTVDLEGQVVVNTTRFGVQPRNR